MKNRTTYSPRIVIAGGGTGGHLFPGIAIAEEFLHRDPKSVILFVISGNPFEISVLSEKKYEYSCIESQGIKGRRLLKQITAVAKIPKGILNSLKILKRFRPDIVLGLGSYSSGPVVAGAWLLGINIALCEQNILPGITNRLLSYFAARIYVAFRNTSLGCSQKKIYFTGNPVRREIIDYAAWNKPEQKDGKLKDKRRFTVMITGGSQGAHSINLAVADALGHIKNKDQFYFIHQTGDDDEDMMQGIYESHGIRCTVKSFLNDMPVHFEKSDFVICRSGATTVAELTVLGKGILFIPYPFAADNHQVLNALSLAEAGAAEMILQDDLGGKLLAKKIEYFASHPESLKTMAARAKKIGRPGAVKKIVDNCCRLIENVS
ncbi:MAG: undecaprenyldiphospho-muramoylpentapeptide beta-N-acetylglucosaminyltransferase [Deltaproteobacteria bacterium]|nr:undecaprenyldiphospho-muramoylpentapeptide beta-N-acetylglucosaminyltransferase [Deltaproteobacteria bacterium]